MKSTRHLPAAVFLLHLISLQAYAGWAVDDANLRYSTKQNEGDATFGEMFKRLTDQGGSLHAIDLHAMFAEETFQKELFAALERESPREWREASKSAGNMHNPKMLQLAAPFQKAVLATSGVKAIESVLSANGLRISKVSYEELELIKTDTGRRLFGFIWLIVEKIPSPNGK